MQIKELPRITPIKKNWEVPQLHIISKNQDIRAGKVYPQIHEGTGIYVQNASSKSFVTPALNIGIIVTTHGNRIGHKSSAAS